MASFYQKRKHMVFEQGELLGDEGFIVTSSNCSLPARTSKPASTSMSRLDPIVDDVNYSRLNLSDLDAFDNHPSSSHFMQTAMFENRSRFFTDEALNDSHRRVHNNTHITISSPIRLNRLSSHDQSCLPNTNLTVGNSDGIHLSRSTLARPARNPIQGFILDYNSPSRLGSIGSMYKDNDTGCRNRRSSEEPGNEVDYSRADLRVCNNSTSDDLERSKVRLSSPNNLAPFSVSFSCPENAGLSGNFVPKSGRFLGTASTNGFACLDSTSRKNIVPAEPIHRHSAVQSNLQYEIEDVNMPGRSNSCQSQTVFHRARSASWTSSSGVTVNTGETGEHRDVTADIEDEWNNDMDYSSAPLLTSSGRNRGLGKVNEPKNKCQVCGDVAAGFHCGAYVCEACKKFFLRCLKMGNHPTFMCPKGNSCDIGMDTRSHCQFCRFQKCIQLGMYKPGCEDDKKLKIDFRSISCKVCNAPSSGFHFGAITCEGCKGFFRRMLKEKLYKKFVCTSGESCFIDSSNRTNCKCCRFVKCLNVGMTLKGTRLGRQSNSIKLSILKKHRTGLSQNAQFHQPGDTSSRPTDQHQRAIDEHSSRSTLEPYGSAAGRSQSDNFIQLNSSKSRTSTNSLKSGDRQSEDNQYFFAHEKRTLGRHSYYENFSHYRHGASNSRNKIKLGEVIYEPNRGSDDLERQVIRCRTDYGLVCNNLDDEIRENCLGDQQQQQHSDLSMKPQYGSHSSQYEDLSVGSTSRRLNELRTPRTTPYLTDAGVMPPLIAITQSQMQTSCVASPIAFGCTTIDTVSSTNPISSPGSRIAVNSFHETFSSNETGSIHSTALKSPDNREESFDHGVISSLNNSDKINVAGSRDVDVSGGGNSDYHLDLYANPRELFNFLWCAFEELKEIMNRSPEMDEIQNCCVTVESAWKFIEFPLIHQAEVVLKFIAKIPGFRQLPMDDQVKIAQEALYPVSLIFHSQYYNMETRDRNYFCCTHDECDLIVRIIPPFDTLRSHYSSTGFSLKQLNMSSDDIVFLSAMTVITADDCCEPMRFKLEDLLVNAFMECCDIDGSRVGVLLARIPELRRANLELVQVATQVQQMMLTHVGTKNMPS